MTNNQLFFAMAALFVTVFGTVFGVFSVFFKHYIDARFDTVDARFETMNAQFSAIRAEIRADREILEEKIKGIR